MYKLRELNEKDITIINKWRRKRELINYLGAPFRYINKKVDYEWYNNYLKNRDSTIRCSIVDNKETKLYGVITLSNIDRLNQTSVLHIMIGDKENRGKGIGKFAVEGILRHAFEDINLNRIELTLLKSNERAYKLYQSCGFKKEGVKREAVFKNGEYKDMIMMGIIKKDYFEKSNCLL